jgi:hypothetical protein
MFTFLQRHPLEKDRLQPSPCKNFPDILVAGDRSSRPQPEADPLPENETPQFFIATKSNISNASTYRMRLD